MNIRGFILFDHFIN